MPPLLTPTHTMNTHKQKLDPKTWRLVIRIMIAVLQMILAGVSPEQLEKKMREMEAADV